MSRRTKFLAELKTAVVTAKKGKKASAQPRSSTITNNALPNPSPCQFLDEDDFRRFCDDLDEAGEKATAQPRRTGPCNKRILTNPIPCPEINNNESGLFCDARDKGEKAATQPSSADPTNKRILTNPIPCSETNNDESGLACDARDKGQKVKQCRKQLVFGDGSDILQFNDNFSVFLSLEPELYDVYCENSTLNQGDVSEKNSIDQASTSRVSSSNHEESSTISENISLTLLNNEENVFCNENPSCTEGRSSEKPKRSRNYVPPHKLTRKRQSNPSAWKCNVSKEKLNKGEEHFNPKGKLVKARKLMPPCDASCRMKCSSNLTLEERQEIFKGFWAISSHVQKWDFIANNVKQEGTVRKTTEQEHPKRKFSRKYSFTIQSRGIIPVCKTMFLATLGICDGWVTTCFKKRHKNFIGHISPDKRGRNKPPPRPESAEKQNTVRQHIECLPRMPSHYTRATSSKEYLEDNITSVADMHALYEVWMDENHPEKKKATYRQYTDIFNNQYNISFFVAKKDQCEDCVAYENATEEGKKVLQEDYDSHCFQKDLAQTMRLADTKVGQLKSSKTLCVANFDYQKTLICPKARASSFYYKRKLSVNNFTIVDSGRHEDFAYCYTEVVGGKGSNEVASLLFDFITKKCEDGINDFRFYSDNCTGQNKNRGVVAMYLHAAAKYKISIRHRFLEKGHTWNAADTVHSIIETKVRPHDIYSPQEYYEKIALAKRKADPIQVIEVSQEILFDFKGDLVPKLNVDKAMDNAPIPWSRIREISVDGAREHEFSFKVNLNEEGKKVATQGVGRPVNLSSYVPKLAYTGPIPISKAKYKDLVYYCEHNLIPERLHTFYKSLPNGDEEEEPVVKGQIPDVTRGRAKKRRVPSKKKPQQKNKKERLEEEAEENLTDDDWHLGL